MASSSKRLSGLRLQQRHGADAAVGADRHHRALSRCPSPRAPSRPARGSARRSRRTDGRCATLPPFGLKRSHGNLPRRASMRTFSRRNVLVLERGHVAQHLRGERLVDLPEVDRVEREVVAREQARDRVGRRHQQALVEDVDRGDLPVDQARARRDPRAARARPGVVRDPDRGRAVGERRGVARGDRALAARAVERGLQTSRASPRSCRRAARRPSRYPRPGITRSSKKPAAIAFTARWCDCERDAVLVGARDLPLPSPSPRSARPCSFRWRGWPRSARAGRTSFQRKLAQAVDALADAARLREAPEPVGEPLLQADLHAAHALHAAAHRERPRRRAASPRPRTPRPCWSSTRARSRRRAWLDRAPPRSRPRARCCSSRGWARPCPTR